MEETFIWYESAYQILHKILFHTLLVISPKLTSLSKSPRPSTFYLASTLFPLWDSICCSISLWPHGLQHTRPPCPSLFSRIYSNSCPLCQWCHPTIWSSVIPFSSCPQSFPALGSFPINKFFASGRQSVEASASASVLPMNIQLGLTGLI